jgi:hypothetical protein
MKYLLVLFALLLNTSVYASATISTKRSIDVANKDKLVRQHYSVTTHKSKALTIFIKDRPEFIEITPTNNIFLCLDKLNHCLFIERN